MPNLSNLLTTDQKGVLGFSPAFFAEGEVKPVAGLLVCPAFGSIIWRSPSSG